MNKEKRRAALVVLTALLAAVAVLVSSYFLGLPKPVQLPTAGRPTVGGSGAPQLVVFEDYKCPACRDFTAQDLPVLEQAAKAGQVQLVFMHRPFLAPDSRAAALAAECVYRTSPALFLTFHKALYARQGPESEAWVTEGLLRAVAQQSGVNVPAWQQCRLSRAAMEAVEQDDAAYLTGKARYTPAFYLDGNLVRSPTLENITSLLAQARAAR